MKALIYWNSLSVLFQVLAPRAAMGEHIEGREPARNVLGTELKCCCADVSDTGIGTGFYRDGFCSTGPEDEGRHTVCVEATEKSRRALALAVTFQISRCCKCSFRLLAGQFWLDQCGCTSANIIRVL